MADDNHCMFFVKKKKRYCRMTIKKGNKYCGEHQGISLTGEELEQKRIKCPLDPTHTCYEAKLSKHLKVCNAKESVEKPPSFIIKDINIGKVSDTPRHVPLSELNNVMIDNVIEKVTIAYGTIPQISEAVLQHKALVDKVFGDDCGRNLKKHLLQNSSLLQHLERANLIKDKTYFIEFGAGKGKLTYWLGQVIKDKRDCGILLVDRSSHRHKNDNKLKHEDASLAVKRIRADIADLQLINILEIQEFEHVVAIAKHLCGAATDLTLNCLAQAIQGEPKCKVSGLVIAFCCHHKCDYRSYVGKKFLEQCGFTPNEFTILCSIASWATCGSKSTKEFKIANGISDVQGTRKTVKRLNSSEREIIGCKAKALLNWGRLEYLRSIGFHSSLFYYTTADISLENMCIVATRNEI